MAPKLSKPVSATLGRSWALLLAGTLFRGHWTVTVTAQQPQLHAGLCLRSAVYVRVQEEAQCLHRSQLPVPWLTADTPGGLASHENNPRMCLCATEGRVPDQWHLAELSAANPVPPCVLESGYQLRRHQ